MIWGFNLKKNKTIEEAKVNFLAYCKLRSIFFNKFDRRSGTAIRGRSEKVKTIFMGHSLLWKDSKLSRHAESIKDFNWANNMERETCDVR